MNSNVEQEANTIDNDPVQILSLLEAFENQRVFASSRKARLEDLMKRRSANKWSPQKTSKMVRRYTSSARQLVEAENAIEHLNSRLGSLSHQPK